MRSGRNGRWLRLTPFFLVAACTTHLETRPERELDAQPVQGPTYRLPIKRYKIAASWRLSKCKPGWAVDGKVTTPPRLGFAIKADPTSEIVEGESFAVDYRRMVNRFKTGELTLEYWTDDTTKAPTRLLKSVNGTIEGKEADALKSGIQAVVNIAKTALMATTGIPAGGDVHTLAPDKPEPVQLCSDETLRDIAALEKAMGDLDTIAADAKAIEARFAALKAHAVFGKLGKADQIEYEKIVKATSRLADRREIAEVIATRLTAKLSHGETFTWVPKQDSKRPEILSPSAGTTAWLAPLLVKTDTVQAQVATDVATLALVVTFEPAAYELAGVAKTDADVQSMCAAEADPKAVLPCMGVVYREPMLGRLKITSKVGGTPNVLSDTSELIPQYGRLHVLPLRSRWGEKNSLTAEFALNGMPTKIAYKAIEAGGPKMMEALSQATGAGLELATAIRKQHDAEKSPQEEELADLKLQSDIADARKKLADLTTLPDPVAAASAKELAALKQQLELADSRDKLATLNATPDEQVKRLNAGLVILRLQAEQAELDASIREAGKR